jgi:hypothetical protein
MEINYKVIMILCNDGAENNGCHMIKIIMMVIMMMLMIIMLVMI